MGWLPGVLRAPVGDGWDGASPVARGKGGEEGGPWSRRGQRPLGCARLTVTAGQEGDGDCRPDHVSPHRRGAHNPSRREGAASARGRPGKRKLCHVRGTGQRG
ncbi:hypothetical protein GCM10023100_63570 [Actinocorallia cavernae]|uniref:Uncharacterized protein n=2 Tax=Actinomycetes TaxID=1760 RepID=A0ABP8T3M9_9ACTN